MIRAPAIPLLACADKSCKEQSVVEPVLSAVEGCGTGIFVRAPLLCVPARQKPGLLGAAMRGSPPRHAKRVSGARACGARKDRFQTLYGPTSTRCAHFGPSAQVRP